MIRERMGEPWVADYLNNAQCVIEDRDFTDKPVTPPPTVGVLRRFMLNFRKK
ncbi:MAG: hypothetical protein H7X86_04190 [Gorillibacterium sp.]|nr:hypothetical protein [Gorillibacterium sp.]